jgi:aminocarboxymuconate-semialdehyde decarboxylase
MHEDGAPFLTITPTMLDYAARIKAMDEVGVDVAIVSIGGPSCYFGGEEVSLGTARTINDDMAAAQRAYPGRIRFLATLPWQYPNVAVAELERAISLGAVGVMVLANIQGMHLTDPKLAPIWKAIDDRALPVLVHPTNPPGLHDMQMQKYNLIATVGFVFDTTLAVTRMVMSGFLDKYPNLKLIAAHGGGTIPYINKRIDIFHEYMATSRVDIETPPSDYYARIYYDAVVYQMNALHACIDLAGASHVLYGSDFPHVTGLMKPALAQVDSLPKDQRDQIRGKNAERIFKL